MIYILNAFVQYMHIFYEQINKNALSKIWAAHFF